MADYKDHKLDFSILNADAWQMQLKLMNLQPSDERRLWASRFFSMLVQHGVILEILLEFPHYKPKLLEAKEVELWPFSTACITTRSLVETYLGFYHLFIENVDSTHREFRFLYWRTMTDRQRSKLLTKIKSKSPQLETLVESNKEDIAKLRSHTLFKSYKDFKGGRVGKLNSDYAQSLGQMAVAAKFPRDYFDSIYGYLSNHTHGSGFAFFSLQRI